MLPFLLFFEIFDKSKEEKQNPVKYTNTLKQNSHKGNLDFGY